MAQAVFDRLECERHLKDAGVPEGAAEALAEQEARCHQGLAILRRQLSVHNWLLAALASTIILPALRDLLAR